MNNDCNNNNGTVKSNKNRKPPSPGCCPPGFRRAGPPPAPPRRPRALPVYLGDGGDEDQILRVEAVTPALVHAGKVTTDYVADGWHLLLRVVDRRGRTVHFLTSRHGVMAIVPIDE